MVDVFSFDNYKSYLNRVLDDSSAVGGRGSRSRLASAIDCQTSYIAHILNGSAHLSAEQAEATNAFLGHSDEEGDFFHLLVSVTRAGSRSLENRLRRQIEAIRKKRLNLASRLVVNQPKLSADDKSRYYSSWLYQAVHAGFALPEQTSDSLSKRFNISPKQIHEITSFLARTGMISAKNGKFEQRESRIHLGSDSPLISKHHSNWRLRAMQALDSPDAEDLHYSSVVTVSQRDARQIREQIIKTISTVKEVVRESPSEILQAFTIDLFSL